MNHRAQIVTAVVVSLALLGACGGESSPDDDAGGDAVETSSTPAPTTAPTTDPPATDPPPTTAGDPALPDWASGELVTVETDTGSREIPVELVAFCETSRSFYLAARGLDFVEEGQTGTTEQLFAALAALAPRAIDTAPSDEFAEEPTAALDQLGVLIPAFQEVGYDGSRVPELANVDTVLNAVDDFTATRDSLQEFLVQACGADVDALDEQARGATDVAAEAAGEFVEPVEAADGVPITNDDSTITVSVPAEWTETEQSGDDDTLVASSNIDAFFGLTAPGVLVLRGEGGFRDGGFVGRVLEFESDLEDAGCVTVAEVDYDDGTYVGEERTFDCGTEGLDVRLLGGTTADESLYAMVLLVNPIEEPGIRQLVVDTFFVS